MIDSTLTVSDLQRETPKIIREIGEKGVCGITRNGRLMAYLVSKEKIEAMIETMEITANPAAMKAVKEYEEGKMTFKPVECLDED